MSEALASAGGAIAGPVTVPITNRRGLHARASAKFVTVASSFDADVTVSHDGSSVTGTSIMGLMMLAAAKGSTVKFVATGPDAEQMLTELEALFAKKFDEA